MLLNGVLPLLLQYWPVVLASLTLGWLLSNKFWKGLNRYPGHWLAGYTNWWRLWDVWGRHHHWNLIRLHREHGDVVRLGPNVLSFADPKAIKIIYGLNKGMVKVWSHLGWFAINSNIVMCSPIFTLSRMRSQKAVVSNPCFLRLTKTTMRDIVAVLTTLSR